jgi:hypothetical protein
MGLNRIMVDPALEADAARLKKVTDARKLAESRVRIVWQLLDLNPILGAAISKSS